MLAVVIGLSAAMSTLGCASSGRRPRGASSTSLCVVTADELRRSSATSLYDALAVVRPTLLRRNAHNELPIVVLDGIVVSDAASLLHTLTSSQVYLARRLSASAATARYGLHEANAVLEIRTHPSRGGETEDDSSSADCG